MENILIEMAAYSTDVHDFALHTHNCYEIIYLRNGSLRLWVADRQYDAAGPALIFLNKLELHSLQVMSTVYERYYLCISPVGAGNLMRDYTLLTLLSNRPVRFRSGLSFNFYIWHQFLAVQLKKWHIPPYTGDAPNREGQQPWQNQYTLLCFAAALLCAMLLTYLVEKPCARLIKRRLSPRKGS